LHRKIARLLATQNAIDVFGGLAKIIPEVDSIGDEPAGRDGAFAGVNRRQAMPPSQRDNEILVGPGDRRREAIIPPFSCIAKDDRALSIPAASWTAPGMTSTSKRGAASLIECQKDG